MSKTQHYELPLPHPSHTLAVDVENLTQAITKIDAALKTIESNSTFTQDKEDLLKAIAKCRTDLTQALISAQTSLNNRIDTNSTTLGNLEQAVLKNRTLALAGL